MQPAPNKGALTGKDGREGAARRGEEEKMGFVAIAAARGRVRDRATWVG